MSIDYIPIPKEIENMQLPDPDLLNQYIDLKNRIIWVADEIDIFTLNIIQDIVIVFILLLIILILMTVELMKKVLKEH